MASAALGSKKLKKKDIPRIEAELYAETGLNDLVLAAIYFLQKHNVNATTEEVVSICFRLFPQKFCLKNHPRWPDSALVIRRLTDCREKGLLRGSLQDGFTFKFKGQKLGERTALALGVVKPAPAKKKLVAKKKAVAKGIKRKVQKEKRAPAKKRIVKQVIAPAKKIVKTPKVKKQVQKKTIIQKPILKKKPLKKKVSAKKKEQVLVVAPPVKVVKPAQAKKKATTPPLTKLQKIQPEAAQPLKEEKLVIATKEEKAKAVQIVRVMEKSDAYKYFSKNGKGTRISEFDFRNMLLATMESSSDTLVRNVNLFKRSANIQGRQDLVTFLIYCETNFADLLKSSAKKTKKK